jgi:hypothetical protein
MQEYDLAVVGILWGTAIAFALSAITMVDSGRKKLLITLWVIAAAFLVAAVVWPWAAEKWPALKAAAESVTAYKTAINVIGIAIFCLLVLDFGLRSGWFSKVDKRRRTENAGIAVELLGMSGRIDAIEAAQLQPSIENHNDSEMINQLGRELSGLRGEFDAFTVTVGTILHEQNVATTKSSSNPTAERDILLLMHFAVYQSTVLMLDDMLKDAPPGISIAVPLQFNGDFALQNTVAKEFVDLIRRKMDPGSQRRSSFENVMNTAEHEAEYNLEQTPMNERPSGIDPLVLRRLAIAHRQCTRAIQFLEHEKKEAKENLLNQRFNLLQRYREQNKI